VRATGSLIAFAMLATALIGQTDSKPMSRPGQPTMPDDTEIKTTASGLKYSVLKAGAPGGKNPGPTDKVKVHYSGWLTNGKLFDSSVVRGQPIEFGLHQVIPGWTEGVQLMTPGSKFKFTIPGNLAYGKAGSPPDIPPDATLVFEVELLSFVEGPKPLKVPDFVKPDESKLQSTPSGLKYEVISEGTGAEPKPGQRVQAHYAGWLTDGTPFDNSYARGQPFAFTVGGGVIKGWTEGIQLMKQGGVYRFVIPPDLAYGPRAMGGRIPANSTLVFQIELVKVD
jgi:peptidylprolyl isomerase